jgi:hypothetical protein
MKMRNVVQAAGVLALTLGVQSTAFAASDYLNERGRRVQAEISGNRMILIGLNKARKTAPDGLYKSLDGKSIVVQGGFIVQGGAAVPGGMQYKIAPTQPGAMATPPAAGGMPDLKKSERQESICHRTT